MKKFLVILMVVAMAAFLFVGCDDTVPETYTLTMAVNPTLGGTTTPAVGVHTYTDGTIVDIVATQASGYQFGGWFGDVADPNSASTTVTMDADKTVIANFELISEEEEVTYDLTMQVSPPGSGTTIPAVGTHNYASGAVVNISAFPATGYEFDKWTGDASGSASTTVTMDADKTVTAKFKELPTTAPIITSVPEADDDDYVNKAEAADGIKVHGTGDKDAEIYLYFVDPVEDKFAGTGDVTATGEWTVRIAKDDLGEDGDKILYATAEQKTRWLESPHSNEIEFTLDTAYPKVKSVKARAGALRLYNCSETTDTRSLFWEGVAFTPGGLTLVPGPPIPLPHGPLSPFIAITAPFTGIPTVNQLPEGVVNWKLEVINVVLGTVTMRVYNLTAGTFIDYTYNNIPPNIVSVSWIIGLDVSVLRPSAVTDIGAYCLITTRNTPEVLGRVSLTFNEDVSFTAATGGAYTIYNNFLGWDILGPFGVTAFMTYNETTDTMFWQEAVNFGSWDLSQGEWLTFQVDSVVDVAGNAIPVGSPETDNTTVLASSVDIGP